MTFLALSTDDILIAYNDDNMMEEILKQFSSRFPITDLGIPRRLLGMRITITDEAIYLDQEPYILEILKRFNMENCKGSVTPAQPGLYLVTSVSGSSPIDAPYRELVGALNWVSTCTRPDFSACTSMLSRFCNEPLKEHWTAAKRALSYLKLTSNLGLRYPISKDVRNLNVSITGFSDSDWGSDPESRQSTSGYIFNLGLGPIAWKSSRQPIVACSSTEAEYIALADASREGSWIKTMITELGFQQSEQIIIYEDNQGCIAISKHRRADKRTKHIDIKYHYVRDQIERGEIKIEYCPTEKMVADAMTKPLNVVKFKTCRDLMGLMPAPAGLTGGVEATPASKAVSHRDQSDELIQESFTDATESTTEERPSAAPGPMASQARTETKAQPRVETVALPTLRQPSSHGDSGHAPIRLVRPREPFPST